MECKRCGQKDHPNARSILCPKGAILLKIRSWDETHLSPLINAKMIAGLLDGDGSVGFDSCNYPRVALTLSHDFGKAVVMLVAKFIGAPFGYHFQKRTDKHYVTWSASTAESVLKLVEMHGVIKAKAASLVLAQEVDKVKRFNGCKSPRITYGHWLKPERICEAWVGGLFAAEGSVSKCEKRIAIAQASHPRILDELLRFIGFGSCTKTQWRASGSAKIALFNERFGKFCLHKCVDLQNY